MAWFMADPLPHVTMRLSRAAICALVRSDGTAPLQALPLSNVTVRFESWKVVPRSNVTTALLNEPSVPMLKP